MNTNEGEVIHVEAYSLNDFANGKRPFTKFKKVIDRLGGAKYGQLVSLAVIEGGVDDGQPSCVFLVLHEGQAADTSQDQFFLFETTAKGLEGLAKSIQVCREYFDKNPSAGEAH